MSETNVNIKDRGGGRNTAEKLKKAIIALALLSFVLSFVGTVNPAKISSSIFINTSIRSKSTYVGDSLFETTGSFLWEHITDSKKTTEKLLSQSENFVLFIGGTLLFLGSLTTGTAAYFSLKFRRIKLSGMRTASLGAYAQFAGLAGILAAYFMLMGRGGADASTTPAASLSWGFFVYLLAAAACAVLCLAAVRLPEAKNDACIGLNVKPKKIGIILRKERELWIIAVLAILFMLLFVYTPMLGNLIGLVNFKVKKGSFLTSLFQADWVGLFQFKRFFSMNKAWLAIRNTLAMGFLNITVGFAAPIILALLLNEIRISAYKRVVQTISYMPHFVSWVVVASLALTILGNDSGIVNNVLRDTGAIGKSEYIPFLNTGKWYWYIITSLNIWKGVGWGSIIYISAITGIDQQLYEAGAIDGLGRFGMVRHITLPGISTTIMMLFILGTAGIINGGMEQHLLLGNQMTIDYYETIDTFVYRYFSGNDVEVDYSLSTAVGMLTSGIAIVLLIITNTIIRKATDMSLF